VEVEYKFVCRNKIDLFTIADRIEAEIKQLCKLKFKQDEIEYLRQQSIFKEDYLEFLKDFQLNYNNIYFPISGNFELIVKDKWVDAILFETPILAIISELYSVEAVNKLAHPFDNMISIIYQFEDNINKIKDIKFVDFGTRRRCSEDWQKTIIEITNEECKNNFLGTSNAMLAKRYNLKPIGTQAHEIFAASQVLAPNLLQSQKFILEQWLDEYKGKLGIALTDIITMDAFLKDFNYDLANAYQGCRHDSGDPYIWGNKLIAHYKNLGIDPMTKTAVFSDGLTFDDMVELNKYFKDRIDVVFGIGTNLTNNVGIEPANIVIKLIKVNGQPVAKISDSPGKTICEDENYIKQLKETFEVA
jgi:nicotinate phosphoribosyltransferase